MRYLLDAAYLLLVILTSPFLLRAKTRHGLWDRFLGRTRAAFGGSPLNEMRVWFHGVSVGEIHLLRHLIAEFRRRHSRARCIVSSTTDTGVAEARRNFPDLDVVRWPLDFSWAVERALSEVRPDLVVLAEGDLWPNFLLAAKRRRIPVVAVNARFSPRSLRRYNRFRAIASRWLNLVSHFAVQTRDYAASLREFGVPAHRVTATGSLKYDGLTGDRGAPKTQALRRLFDIDANDLVWIAGSTQAPEEELALDAFLKLRGRYPNLRLILVPRQRERFDEVAELLRARGVEFVRRSEMSQARACVAALPARLNEVILLDTIGELSAAWGLADIAFVGGSLDGRRGGQNMIEPAAYGAAVLFGPHTWNFRETVDGLLAANAARVVRDAAELESCVEGLIANSVERHRLGSAARQMVQSRQGATARTLDLLDRILAADVQSLPSPAVSCLATS